MKSFVLALLSTTFIQAAMAEENHAKRASNYLEMLQEDLASVERDFVAGKAATEERESHF